jgi:ADP-heptose:LPS heptosyltransferase
MPHSGGAPAAKNKKILCYLFGSLGDSIVAIPALRAVRRRFPDAEIVLLQNFQSGELVVASQVIPEGLVDRYLSYSSASHGLGRILGFARLWVRLRLEGFNAAVYLVLSERPESSVARDRRFFSSCGIPELYGFHAYSNEQLYPKDPAGHPALVAHEAFRKLERIDRDGISTDPAMDLQVPLLEHSPDEIETIDAWLKERGRRPGKMLVSLAPGCKSPANEWPVENFERIGKRLLAERDCDIVVTGGPAEREMGERLIAKWGRGINAAGSFSVKRSGALLSMCDVHIGLDTGTTHLAAVAGTRCFVIFGERANPGLWYPLGEGHTIVYHSVPCAGCRVQVCPVPGHPCMSGILLDAVWPHLDAFLNAHGASPVATQVFAV